jgi:hypothetical protein
MPRKQLTPDEVEMRGEAAALIRKHLWLGTRPPPPHPTDRPWHMGRDLSIWKRLVLLGQDAEELNGAIEVVRELLPDHAHIPLRLTVFYNRQGYATPLLEEAKGRWQKRRLVKPQALKGQAREHLHSLLRGLIGEGG